MKDKEAGRHRVVYQVRHGDGTEPHTLIASDLGDALQQAATLARSKCTAVQLFGDGAFIAECPKDTAVALADLPADLADALSSRGLTLVGWRRPDEGNRKTMWAGLN